MNSLFKKVKDLKGEGFVSIILNTHKTHPDNLQDGILLSNLLKDAISTLHEKYGKQQATAVEDQLTRLIATIDHNYNNKSMILYANEQFAEMIRLPIVVENRIVIDNTFATRDLIRAIYETGGYYILHLSRDHARLIEAYNDELVQEFQEVFPLQNDLVPKNNEERSTSRGTDGLIESFFNTVDKAYQQVINDKEQPLILVTETRNYDYYLKVADKTDFIAGHINRLPADEKAEKIVAECWVEMQTLIKAKNAARIKELEHAVNSGKFLSDYNDIWKAVQEGRGKTIFVRRDFYQPAIVKDNIITTLDNHQPGEEHAVEDIIDEMIEINLAAGGDVVFVKNDDLADFQHLALVTRY